MARFKAGDRVQLKSGYSHGHASFGPDEQMDPHSGANMRPGLIGVVSPAVSVGLVDDVGDVRIDVDGYCVWAKEWALELVKDEPQGDQRFSPLDASTLRNIADMLDAVEARDMDPGVGIGAWFESPVTVVTDGMRLGYLVRDDFWSFVPDFQETV